MHLVLSPASEHNTTTEIKFTHYSFNLNQTPEQNIPTTKYDNRPIKK